MFLDAGPRLLVYGVTVATWTARYGVEPFSHPCYVCGRRLTTTIPFAQGQLRGLCAPRCACGDEQTPYALVRDPKYGDLLSGTEAPRPKRARSRTKGRVIDARRRFGR